MGTITLPNFRVTADVTMNTRLKDGGVYIDWAGLSNIKAWLYSDAQKAIAGRCDVSINQTDSTKLVCEYSATKPQYLGVNRLIVQGEYMGRTKTYDKPVFNFVRWTDDQAGEELVIDDPIVDVEISVEDISSSLIERLIAACIKATEEAQEVVDTSRGPRGYSAYEIAVQDGFEGTEEEWLASLQGEEGPAGPQGAPGAPGEPGAPGTPGVTSAEVSVDGTSGEPSAQATVENGVLNIQFSGLKGEQGPAGPQGEQGSQGQTGPAGSTGPQGKSAYQVAVDEGFEGTEEQWLASLVGPQGQQGIQGVQGPQGIQGATGPQGETGATGATGATGPQGETGATPDFSIGTVSTGAAGSQAAASITGTAAAPVLNLVIPKGDQGNTGSSVDYPYELVNNRTTNDATKGLSAAEGKRLGDDLSQLEAVQSKIFTTGAKQLLIDLLKKVAYIDNDVEDDVEDLEYLLLGNAELVSISAVFTPGTEKFYPGQSLDVLKPYLEVTGHYDDSSEREIRNYTLSGTLTTGTSTITVAYGEKTTIFNVTVEDVVYYRDGGLIQTRCSLRSAYTSSNKSRAATIDGTTYWFTQAYPAIDGAKSRACYYLFDLLLTAGETYKFDMYYSGLPVGGHLTAQLHGYDETFRAAGVANQEKTSADYSSHIFSSDWINNIGGDGEKVSFEVEIPAGSVGARIQLIYKNSSDVETIWPEDFVFTKLVINEVTSE